jgi:restriction endonuclease S subunit
MEEKLRGLAKEKHYKVDYLSDVCSRIFNGKTGEEYVSVGVPIIKLRNVTNEGLDWNSDFVIRQFYDETPECHVDIDDVLVTATGDGTIGRVDMVDRQGAMIAVDVVALRANQKTHPSYLLHYLRSIFGRMQFDRFTVGSTGQTHLKNIDKFLIIYPENKDEQLQKVKVADEYISKAIQKRREYAKEKTEAKISLVAESRRLVRERFYLKTLSIEERRFDFEYNNPGHGRMWKEVENLEREGYAKSTLGILCHVFRGKTAKIYVSVGIPIIKLRNVTGEGIDWDTDFVLRPFFDENLDLHLEKNDVLLTSTGDGTIGRVDMLDKESECISDGHVTVLRIKDEKKDEADPFYLNFYLRSFFAQAQFDRFTVGSTGQTELNEDYVRDVAVVHPKSLKEQRKLADSAYDHETKSFRAKKEYLESVELSKTEFIKSLGFAY